MHEFLFKSSLSLSSLSFHCRIIYYEAQTYFILASILIPAQNIFFLSVFPFSVLYMIYAFYTRAILPFMYLNRVKVQTFKLWKKGFRMTLKWIDVLFISNGFLDYSSLSSFNYTFHAYPFTAFMSYVSFTQFIHFSWLHRFC